MLIGCGLNAAAPYAPTDSGRLALLLTGIGLQGMNGPFINAYRFLAAEVSGFFFSLFFYFSFLKFQFLVPPFVPVAISFTVGGAVIAAVCIPRIAIATRGPFEGVPEFAATYFVLLGIYAGLVALLAFAVKYQPLIDRPEWKSRLLRAAKDGKSTKEIVLERLDAIDPSRAEEQRERERLNAEMKLPVGKLLLTHTEPRKLKEVITQKIFLLPAVSAFIFYTTMVWQMVTLPVVMLDNGFTFDDVVNSIMSHMLGMFFPSFFVGYFVKWFGAGVFLFSKCRILRVFFLSHQYWKC
jgi:hypothetical protein